MKLKSIVICLVLTGLLGASALASELDQAFAPRKVPGLELQSLDVPVKRVVVQASPAPQQSTPAPMPAEKPHRDLWRWLTGLFTS